MPCNLNFLMLGPRGSDLTRKPDLTNHTHGTAQVTGRKHVLLMGQSETFKLYPFPVGHPQDNFAMVDLEVCMQRATQLWSRRIHNATNISARIPRPERSRSQLAIL